MGSIIQRLKRLEQICPDRLVILADFDGVEKECFVEELEANPNAKFVRVLGGNSVEDLVRILEWIGRLADD